MCKLERASRSCKDRKPTRIGPARVLLWLVVLGAAFWCSVPLALAGTFTEEYQFPNASGAAGDHFGSSVAVSADGKTAAVGAVLDDVGLNVDQGSVKIYVRGIDKTWSLQQSISLPLSGSDPNLLGNDYDRFGSVIDLSDDGDVLVVGMPAGYPGSTREGSVLIYVRSAGSWSQAQWLTPPDPEQTTIFGHALALSGDGQVLALSEDEGGVRGVSVYSNSAGNWVQVDRVTGARSGACPARGDFGESLALSETGSSLVVGSPDDNLCEIGGTLSRGSVTLFDSPSLTSWSEGETLFDANGASSDKFGRSVAISAGGGEILVSRSPSSNLSRGGAVIFEKSAAQWSSGTFLSTGWFGASVALSSSGDLALVSVCCGSISTGGQPDQRPLGKAMLFGRSGGTWGLKQTFEPPAGSDYFDSFAGKVDLSRNGRRILLGVPGDDVAGNSDQGSAVVFSESVAATPVISSKPSLLTKETTASFVFSGADAIRYECSIDDSSFGVCGSPKSYESLADGLHTFRVKAYDFEENPSSAASATWTVDTQGPEQPQILQAPSPLSADASPAISFQSTEASSYECKLDSGLYQACSSPLTLSGLTDGEHSFSVRGLDSLGNASSAASRTWVVDSTAPGAPTVTRLFEEITSQDFADFVITGEDGATFECRLDGGAYEPCESGHGYTSLLDGLRSFRARQIDRAGNISVPSMPINWTIDTLGPAPPRIESRPRPRTKLRTAFIRLKPSPGTDRFECKLNSRPTATCLGVQRYTGLRLGAQRLTIWAMDGLGNRSSPLQVMWRIVQ